MSRLADEFIAGLEGHDGGSEYEEEEEPERQQEARPSSTNGNKRKAGGDPDEEDMSEDEEDEENAEKGPDGKRVEVGSLVLEGGVKPADELDAEDVQRMELGAIEDVAKIAKLEGSKRMNEILKVCFIFFSETWLMMDDRRKLTNTKQTLHQTRRWLFLHISTQSTTLSCRRTIFRSMLIMKFSSCIRYASRISPTAH